MVELQQEEIWKDIKDCKGRYQISNFGNVKSLARFNNGKFGRLISERILKQNFRQGYAYVRVFVNGKKTNLVIHRLVAETFIPNPQNLPQVNHIDGNKQNNNVNNLEWCLQRDNLLHAIKNSLRKISSGEKAPNAKLKQKEVDYIRSVYKPKSRTFGAKALAEKFGVHTDTITKILIGNTWKN